MEKPIFILGSHKSGTSLLRNLLDGAPELFVVPLETHLFQFTGYWIEYALRRNLPSPLTFNDVLANLTAHICKSNQNTDRTGDSLLTGQWNIQKFTDYLSAQGAEPFAAGNLRSLNQVYLEAIHLSLYGKLPTASRFVEKSVENAEYAAPLYQLYPDAKFVHILRNPYATLVSIRKYMSQSQGHYPFLANLLSVLQNSYYYLYKNPLLIPSYRIVRYEDLVAEPHSTMQEIAAFVEIEFSDALLAPTTMGSDWRGNSTTGQTFQGVSNKPATGWQRDIQPMEAALVNRLFAHVLRDYNYPTYQSRASIYRPAHREKPAIYLANRLLWLIQQRTTRGNP